MKKIVALFFASLLACTAVRAEVVMTDGTLAVYNPLETYVPSGALGPDIFSIGFIFTRTGNSFDITLQAPSDLVGQLLWAVTTGIDGTGIPSIDGSLLAGEMTVVTMGRHGVASVDKPSTGWFSMAAFDMPVPIAFGSGVPGVIDVQAPVPEPSTWVLLLLGLGIVGFLAKRQRSILA